MLSFEIPQKSEKKKKKKVKNPYFFKIPSLALEIIKTDPVRMREKNKRVQK